MRTLLIGLTACALASCGGKVVIDQQHSGGAGGADAGPPATDICATYCEQAVAEGCGANLEPSCLEYCEQQAINVGACAKEYLDLAACLSDNANVCGLELPPSCVAAREAFWLCLFPGLCDEKSGQCEVKLDGGCECVLDCGGIVEAHCDGKPNATCSCLLDGKVVGTCQEPPSTGYCQLTTGCCAGVFAGLK